MSSTDNSADDHEYFQAIEESFIRLRGAPLLLSPADWQLARQWHRQGIPLSLVLETLEAVSARRAEKEDAHGRVQGLRYCAPAIEAAWLQQSELLATGVREAREPLDIQARLESLAKVVQELPFETRHLSDRIGVLEGSPETVEQSLLDLDRDLIEMASGSLDQDQISEIEDSAAKSLAKVRARLPEDEIERVRQRLYRQAVRRHFGLPVLSLFEDRF